MSTYPLITAGMSPTSLLLQQMLPQEALKGADQSVTSNSTTFVNDSVLAVPVAASATYKVKLLCYYTGGTHATADIKFNFTYPSGASSAGVGYVGQSPALAVQQGTVVLGGPLAFGTNTTSSIMLAELKFTFTTSLTAGTLQLEWCQNTSSATATTVKAGSLMTARRVA